MTTLILAGLLALSDPPRVPTVSLAQVRPLSSVAKSIVDEAMRRSPTITGMIDELRQFNVIVYVELRLSYMAERGATSILSVSGDWRLLRVALSDKLDPAGRILTLGHELYHALEIARETAVRDDKSFRALFGRIGYPMGRSSFETTGALDIELLIRRDLSRGSRAAANQTR